MKRARRILMVTAGLAIALALAHFGLIHWLADKNMVSAVFAAGPQVPKTTLAAAGLFLAVRIATVWLLPGFILSGLGSAAFEWWTRKYFEKPPDRKTDADDAPRPE